MWTTWEMIVNDVKASQVLQDKLRRLEERRATGVWRFLNGEKRQRIDGVPSVKRTKITILMMGLIIFEWDDAL